jgi:zinc protease
VLRRFFLVLTLSALAVSTISAAHAADPGAPIKTTLPNGLRIICKPETDTPLVAVDVFVRAGAPQETDANAGIGSFVAHSLFASTTTSIPETMTRDINALGGNVGATWHPDWTQIAALTVKDKFSDAVFLLADVLKNATFDPDVVENQRQQILSELDNRDADLFQTAYGNLQKTLYAGTSYGRPEGGSPAAIKRLARVDLLRYYTRYYIPQNIVFVVVGNITPEEAQREITNDLDDFPRTGRVASGFSDPLPPLTHDLPPLRIFQPDLDQEIVMAGYRAAPSASPDYPALLVANALEGGMKSGRLFTQIRDHQGLAYDLGSLYTPRLAAGDLVGYVFGATTKIDPTTKKAVPTVGLIKESLLTQFAGLQTTLPSPADLARAQHFLIGSYNLRHERIEDRTTLLGIAELSAPDGYKLDTDYAKYINAVTAADVQRVAAKYFVHPVISTVEPDIKDSIAGGGPTGG